MPLSQRQRQLIEDWSVIDDRQERMAAIVEHGRTAAKAPPAARSDELRLRGCVSAAWIHGSVDGDGRMRFLPAADSPLVEGLLVLLCDFYGGELPADVASCEEDPLTLLGLLRDLSPSRQAGLASARQRIRDIARTAAN